MVYIHCICLIWWLFEIKYVIFFLMNYSGTLIFLTLLHKYLRFVYGTKRFILWFYSGNCATTKTIKEIFFSFNRCVFYSWNYNINPIFVHIVVIVAYLRRFPIGSCCSFLFELYFRPSSYVVLDHGGAHKKCVGL